MAAARKPANRFLKNEFGLDIPSGFLIIVIPIFFLVFYQIEKIFSKIQKFFVTIWNRNPLYITLTFSENSDNMVWGFLAHEPEALILYAAEREEDGSRNSRAGAGGSNRHLKKSWGLPRLFSVGGKCSINYIDKICPRKGIDK